MSGRSPPTPPGLYAAGVGKWAFFALFPRAEKGLFWPFFAHRGPSFRGSLVALARATRTPGNAYPGCPGRPPLGGPPGARNLAPPYWALRRSRGGASRVIAEPARLLPDEGLLPSTSLGTRDPANHAGTCKPNLPEQRYPVCAIARVSPRAADHRADCIQPPQAR